MVFKRGVTVFGIGNLITNALVIIAVLVLRRLERGYDPMLDYDGRKEEYSQMTNDKPQTPENEVETEETEETEEENNGQLPVIA